MAAPAELVDEYANTYLIKACVTEEYPVLLQLVRDDADVNAANKFGETPLTEAARYAYKDEEAALGIVKLLLDEGANINAQTIDGVTALMNTAYYGYSKVAFVLISRGADVNLRRKDGNTVLSSVEAAPSVARRRKRNIKMLEEAGAIR